MTGLPFLLAVLAILAASLHLLAGTLRSNDDKERENAR